MFRLDLLENETAQVLLTLAIMLLAGFLFTRVTKRLRLPNVTGYILAGVLIGPYVLNLIPASVTDRMDFVTDIALAFIAFGVGRYFKGSDLRASGGKVIVITLFEALAAFAAVTLVLALLCRLPLPLALLLGAIASATAPASTIMTIRQYRAKGPFVQTILQVVALDDAVALVAFSVCTAVIAALQGGAVRPGAVLAPVLWNLAAVGAGVAAGVGLHRLADGAGRSSDHRLVLVVAALLLISGLCAVVEVSPLLACMALGTAYLNAGGRKETFDQVGAASPPVLLLFFVLSGARLNVPMLATVGAVGVVYFVTRIAGKYAGAWLGALACKAPAGTRKYLGLALVPQAGVSIGLAALAQRLLPDPASGALISTIILSSGVLYELVGPACAKASLYLSHTLERTPPAEQKAEQKKTIQYPKAG